MRWKGMKLWLHEMPVEGTMFRNVLIISIPTSSITSPWLAAAPTARGCRLLNACRRRSWGLHCWGRGALGRGWGLWGWVIRNTLVHTTLNTCNKYTNFPHSTICQNVKEPEKQEGGKNGESKSTYTKEILHSPVRVVKAGPECPHHLVTVKAHGHDLTDSPFIALSCHQCGLGRLHPCSLTFPTLLLRLGWCFSGTR